MATKNDVTAAYEMIEAAEKQAILDIETAKKAYNDAIDAIVARFPVNGAMTPARQYLTTAKGAGYDYQLTTLKQQYGLIEAAPTITPAPTSGGTNV
jgi:hypothetical protein